MIRKSRIATVLASLAMVSLAAPPAMANHDWGGWGGGYKRHRDRVDTGDVIAGILILGGIAAVASAASNAKKNKQRDSDYRYRDNDYPQQRERSTGDYADDDRNNRSESRGDNGIDGAIDRCMDEVSRGSTKVGEVDSVNRDGEGWRVQGSTSNGGTFTCSIDGDGRIRNVSIDGRAI